MHFTNISDYLLTNHELSCLQVSEHMNQLEFPQHEYVVLKSCSYWNGASHAHNDLIYNNGHKRDDVSIAADFKWFSYPCMRSINYVMLMVAITCKLYLNETFCFHG